jgi:predicted transcriptional regulator
MKAVLISIQPKWCELIASGKKTVEVRKTKPKLETPFKCYIYETQGRTETPFIDEEGHEIFKGRGRVIGEFVCDWVVDSPIWRLRGNTGFLAPRTEKEKNLPEMACLSLDELKAYVGSENKCVCGWHISDLVIYDKPKELSEFYVEGDCDCMNCRNCAWFDRGNGYNVEDDCNLAYKGADEHKSYKPIKRPPQSWCYVEEVGR